MARLASGLTAAALMFAPLAAAVAVEIPAPLDRARTLLGNGKVTEALAVLRAGVAIQPGDAALHNALGAVLNREGRYREALVHAERAAVLAPANPRYRHNRAIVLAEHGRFAQARADFDYAIAATPAEAPMYLERGAALLALGQADKARADWATARLLDAKLVWVDWYEGLHDLIDGKLAAAIAALKQVATAQPDFAPAQSWLLAGHLLSESSYQPRVVNDPWVARILEFHAGKINGEQLLEIAQADATTGDRRREGEAWLHIALRLRAANRAEARKALEMSVSVDAPRHIWKQFAERMLERT